MKQLGIDDEHIILMDAGKVLHDQRNSERGKLFISDSIGQGRALGEESQIYKNELFEHDIEIDYQGEQVNINTLRYVLTGNSDYINTDHRPLLLPTLHSNTESTIFFYFAGHGGDEFFKFHDYEELEAYELMLMFHEMYRTKRFKQMLVILDTCQAATMSNDLQRMISTSSSSSSSSTDPIKQTIGNMFIPNITFIASSRKDENSYAFQTNHELGIATVDRYTYLLYEELQSFRQSLSNEYTKKKKETSIKKNSPKKSNSDKGKNHKLSSTSVVDISIQEFFQKMNKPYFLHAQPTIVSTSEVSVDQLKLLDFIVPPHLHPGIDDNNHLKIHDIVDISHEEKTKNDGSERNTNSMMIQSFLELRNFDFDHSNTNASLLLTTENPTNVKPIINNGLAEFGIFIIIWLAIWIPYLIFVVLKRIKLH